METSSQGIIPPVKHNSGLVNLDCKLRAKTALDDGDYSSAIYYQTLSLGAAKREKYSKSVRLSRDLDSIIKNLSDAEPVKSNNDTSVRIQDAYDDLCKRCRSLPDEWTVMQISKEFTPMATCLTHEEQLNEPTPIWLTIFRCSDAVEESRSEPMLLVFDPPADDPNCKYPNFFEHISSIPVDVRNAITGDESTSSDESQSNRLEAVEQLITSAVQRTIDWLGPWSNLLIGKFRSQADQQLEVEIFNRVEEFCIKHKINRTSQRLVSLVARRLDLLQNIHLYELCTSEQLNLDIELGDTLYTFLRDIRKSRFSTSLKTIDSYPVLLVVDELLDSLPWEMLFPTSEMCRFSSFWVLSELYRSHRNRIEYGYLSISTKNCYAIINPDKNLEKMSVRLQMFYKEWYPEFQLLVDRPPSEAEFNNMLNQSDVVIYNGHGSGLQFVTGDSLLQRDINCVTFLFGCASVRLYSIGLFTEMSGTHKYYNAAQCPAVVGALWVLTDFFTDIYSILLVGNWIPSTNAKYADRDISSIDTLAFKAGTLRFNKVHARKNSVEKHDSLLKLMGDCRMYSKLPLRIRCALVCRGLPIKNKLCK